MGYTDNEHMVRVDIFKPSGEWYSTESMEWLTWNAPCSETPSDGGKDIHLAFREALNNHWKDGCKSFEGWLAVCIKPYHEHAHPLIIVIGKKNEPVREEL